MTTQPTGAPTMNTCTELPRNDAEHPTTGPAGEEGERAPRVRPARPNLARTPEESAA
jgi:hypothetical protein